MLEKLTFMLLCVVAIGGSIKWILEYFAKKKMWEGNKNLAKQIEDLRAEHSKNIESLKAEYVRKQTIHSIRFETEFTVYKEIWDAIYRLQSMSPITPSVDKLPIDPEKQKGEYLGRLLAAYKAFQKADAVIDLSKPFYSPRVYSLARSLSTDCLKHLRKIRRRVEANHMDKCYEMADEFRNNNRERIEEIEVEIRKAIELLDKAGIVE